MWKRDNSEYGSRGTDDHRLPALPSKLGSAADRQPRHSPDGMSDLMQTPTDANQVTDADEEVWPL